jgi:hypothetical protein
LPLPDDSDQSEDAEGCVNEQQTNKRSMLKHHMVELYADNQKLKDKNAKKMGNIRSLVITEIGTDLGDDPDEVSNDLPGLKCFFFVFTVRI